MFRKVSDKLKEKGLSMRAKITLSLSAIAVTLLVSSIISIMEYSRMSNYVSGLMTDNVRSINVAQKLAEVSSQYNLEILSVIGDESVNTLPDFRQAEFMNHCDSLRMSLMGEKMMPLTDSVVYAYSAYMLTSMELNDVLLSDFIDTRSWYFERLQPQYQRLNRFIDTLDEAIYQDLKKNSETFQRGFYRSIIPGAVAVMVGLLLIITLLMFILAYYVNPIYKMLSGLNNYRTFNKKYSYTFDGDDQLVELNDGIKELAGENQQLRKRVSDLREKAKLSSDSQR
jgi:predicted PurR-regulated permease PerM